MKTNMWGFGFLIILIGSMLGLGYLCSSYSTLKDNCSKDKEAVRARNTEIAQAKLIEADLISKNSESARKIEELQGSLNFENEQVGIRDAEINNLRGTLTAYGHGEIVPPFPVATAEPPRPSTNPDSPAPVDPRNYACLVPLAWILLTAGLASAAVYIIRRKQTGSGNVSGNQGVAVYMSREDVSDFLRYKRTKPNSTQSNR